MRFGGRCHRREAIGCGGRDEYGPYPWFCLPRKILTPTCDRNINLTRVCHIRYTFVKGRDTCHTSLRSACNAGYCCYGVPIAIYYEGYHALAPFCLFIRRS